MKVLMTADTVGGVWTYALELARALHDSDVQVVLATMGETPTDEQRESALALESLTLHESSFRLEWMSDPWGDLEAAGEWLLELEAIHAPDVIHLNGYVHGALPFTAPVLVVAHSCVLSWWRAVRRCDAPVEWDRYRDSVSCGLAGASMVAAPSMAMLRALRALYRTGDVGRVIANGRSPELFPRGRKEPLVFSAGRLWDDAKNAAAVERIAADIAWPVAIAGMDTEPGGGDSPRVTGCGSALRLGRLEQPEMAEWMGRAAIFALPARYEPFGLAPLEAALAGCALVLGDIESLREVWEDSALFVPCDDDRALATTLDRLIRDKALRGTMSTRARERALTYTPERMASDHRTAYVDLAAAERTPSGGASGCA